MQVWSLGHKDPLEEGTATHSRILAWMIPWTEEPGGLLSLGLQRVRHDWSDLACIVIYTQSQNIIIDFFFFFRYGFPGGSEVKESACNMGDPGSIPGLRRYSGEGHGNPFQYSCLRIPWTEEPGGLQSMKSQRAGRDWVAKHAMKLDCS